MALGTRHMSVCSAFSVLLWKFEKFQSKKNCSRYCRGGFRMDECMCCVCNVGMLLIAKEREVVGPEAQESRER